MRWRRPPSRWCAAVSARRSSRIRAMSIPAKVGAGASGVHQARPEPRAQGHADQGPGPARCDRAERGADHRHGRAGRLHALLGRRLYLRLQQAPRPAARRDQAAHRPLRSPEPEAQDCARLRHHRRRNRGRWRRARSPAGDEAVRSEVHRLPLGHGPHGDARRRHVGNLDAVGRPVHRGSGLAGSRLGPGPRAQGRGWRIRGTVSARRAARDAARRQRDAGHPCSAGRSARRPRRWTRRCGRRTRWRRRTGRWSGRR